MDVWARGEYLDELRRLSAMGDIPISEIVSRLRRDITGLDEERFCEMCRVSLQSLRQIETGHIYHVNEVLNAILKPFGMQIGFVRKRQLSASGG